MQAVPDKKSIRKEYISNKENLTSSVVDRLSQIICDSVYSHIDLQGKAVVAGYHPINNEVDILPLLFRLNQHNITTCLPTIVGKNQPLIFKKWSHGEQLINSKFFNIKEPDAKIIKPEIIIAPLVAFDNEKNRLGYGGGFYDRTLDYFHKNNHHVTTIGVAYSLQKHNQLPTEKTDHKLDVIITENIVL